MTERLSNVEKKNPIVQMHTQLVRVSGSGNPQGRGHYGINRPHAKLAIFISRFSFIFLFYESETAASWLEEEDANQMYCNCLEGIFSRDPGSLSR